MNRQFLANIPLGTLLFDRFRLIQCLHASDESGIYLCADCGARNRLVVLKVFSAPFLNAHGLKEAVFHEIALSYRVRHPHVVRYEMIFEDDDFVALCMEYCPGGTLAGIMQSSRLFSFHEVMEYLSQLCAGLGAVHRAGILHRDLKPENVLIAENRVLKIGDFGIASLAGDQVELSHDRMSGTIEYMSPEYIRSGEFSEASDIYAIGVMAYRMLTARFPFEGDSVVDLLTARVLNDPAPVRQFRTDCPEALEALVMRTVSRFDYFRFHSCDALADELQQLTRGAWREPDRLSA